MATMVDGNALAREIRGEAAARLAELAARGHKPPRVAIVQDGASAAASLYTRQLHRAFAEARVAVEVHPISTGAPASEAVQLVRGLSQDPAVHGIQIQTPLPSAIPLGALVEALDPAKDLDGIHPCNAGLLAQGRPSIVPATALAGLEILLRHQVAIVGARAVVVGRSTAVGRPLALLLLQHHATVTVCHTRTRSLAAIVAEADILVAAAGRPGLIAADWIRPGAAVLDFGVTIVEGKSLGDVEPSAAQRAGLLTPVPGGAGPVTTAMLLRNLVTLYQRSLEDQP